MSMTGWQRRKQQFLEGAGLLFDLVIVHGLPLKSRKAREAFMNSSIYSVVLEKGQIVTYLHPSKGKPVRMPAEFNTSDNSIEYDYVVSSIVNEYRKGDKTMQRHFDKAFQEFKDSGAGKRLMFYRNGKTELVRA